MLRCPILFFIVVMKKLFALLAAIFLAGIGDDNNLYSLFIFKPLLIYYDFIVDDDAVENTRTPKQGYKFLEGGSVVVKKNGVTYSVNGQRVQ